MNAGEDQKVRLARHFDRLSATYDGLRFLPQAALRLVERVDPPPGARVLDVATGTGVAALAAARRAGTGGRVTGIDFSEGMLARAREKAAVAGLGGIEFHAGDAERLDYPDGAFDAVLCAAALFFVPDMEAALREWRRVLADGGRAGFSSFGPGFLQPLKDLWAARLRRYGLEAGGVPTHRLVDPAVCAGLLAGAGFRAVEVVEEQLGYRLGSAEERWADIIAGREGRPLERLEPELQARVKAEHLAELAALDEGQGIWVDVPAIFTVGVKG